MSHHSIDLLRKLGFASVDKCLCVENIRIMKTDFDKFRKCYHAGLAVAVIVLLFAFGDLILLKLHSELALERWYDRTLFWIVTVGSGIIIAGLLLMWRYSKCPHCGKSAIPFWGNRKIVKCILKRKSIVCAHCGEEVETD